MLPQTLGRWFQYLGRHLGVLPPIVLQVGKIYQHCDPTSFVSIVDRIVDRNLAVVCAREGGRYQRQRCQCSHLDTLQVFSTSLFGY